MRVWAKRERLSEDGLTRLVTTYEEDDDGNLTIRDHCWVPLAHVDSKIARMRSAKMIDGELLVDEP